MECEVRSAQCGVENVKFAESRVGLVRSMASCHITRYCACVA